SKITPKDQFEESWQRIKDAMKKFQSGEEGTFEPAKFSEFLNRLRDRREENDLSGPSVFREKLGDAAATLLTSTFTKDIPKLANTAIDLEDMFRAQVDRMFEDSLEGLSFDEKLQTRELLENYNDPMEGVGKHNFSAAVFKSAA